MGDLIVWIIVIAAVFFVMYAMFWGEEYRDVERKYMAAPKEQLLQVKIWRDKTMNLDDDKRLTDKLIGDRKYQEKLISRANDVMKTIPGLDDIWMMPPAYPEDFYASRRRMVLMKMFFYVKAGKIPSEWGAGWIFSKAITNLLNRELSNQEIIAFFKWYESELKKNGYPDADIKAKVLTNGYPVEWHFAECSDLKGLRKMW